LHDFGAESCHFKQYCNILEFELLIPHSSSVVFATFWFWFYLGFIKGTMSFRVWVCLGVTFFFGVSLGLFSFFG
jgi:hypothetical protein